MELASLPLRGSSLECAISFVRDCVLVSIGYLHSLEDISLGDEERVLSDETRFHNNAGIEYSMGRAPNLKFSAVVEAAIAETELIFLAVHTPTESNGVGKRFSVRSYLSRKGGQDHR